MATTSGGRRNELGEAQHVAWGLMRPLLELSSAEDEATWPGKEATMDPEDRSGSVDESDLSDDARATGKQVKIESVVVEAIEDETTREVQVPLLRLPATELPKRIATGYRSTGKPWDPMPPDDQLVVAMTQMAGKFDLLLHMLRALTAAIIFLAVAILVMVLS